MGDKIEVEKIKLLYGYLYQIDVFNESKNVHERIFIEKDLIENCETEDYCETED